MKDQEPQYFAYPETDLERTTRYMIENVEGAYESVYPTGHLSAGRPRVNSGTCVLICCYMNALGKVLLRGGPEPPRKDFQRFRTFIHECMGQLEAESATKGLRLTPKGREGGVEWLYEVFRCGFVHGFYPGRAGGWIRRPEIHEFWVSTEDLVVLNVDHLYRAFRAAIPQFRALVEADDDLKAHFIQYLLAD